MSSPTKTKFEWTLGANCQDFFFILFHEKYIVALFERATSYFLFNMKIGFLKKILRRVCVRLKTKQVCGDHDQSYDIQWHKNIINNRKNVNLQSRLIECANNLLANEIISN